MPHLTIDYTANLETALNMPELCKLLANELLGMRSDPDGPLFPLTGTRVLARPAPFFAVADGADDNAFMYMNLRIAAGRSDAVKKRVGEALLACATQYLQPVFSRQALGLTIHIDDMMPSFDGKHNNLSEHLN